MATISTISQGRRWPQAYEAAPETIRYNGYARRIVLEETEAASSERRRRALELAERIGLLAA